MLLSLKCNRNRFLDRQVCWIFYPLAYRKLSTPYAYWACRNAKITEIRSFLTPITQKATEQYLGMVHAKRNCQEQIRRRQFSIYQTHLVFFSVFFHYSRRILRSLASVLEFRRQSLMLKYIEIGLSANKGARAVYYTAMPRLQNFLLLRRDWLHHKFLQRKCFCQL